MKPVSNETLARQLNWRYATKKFDAKRKIQPPDWKTLEQALLLSPSSFGLQPWRFFVINDPAKREALKAAAWNQSQITDASHLVVFAVRTDMSAADVERFIARVAEVRNVELAKLDGYKNMILGFVNRPAEVVRNWNTRQVYIALGNFLSAAAMLGIDACPMEGFDPAKVDEILGLGEKGFASVVFATAGYRSTEDEYAKLPKVRFAAEDVIQHV